MLLIETQHSLKKPDQKIKQPGAACMSI